MIRVMTRELRTTVNGRPTRYLESGTGRALVLLHGFPLTAEMWQPQLDRVPDGWRFIAPDLRGFGADPSEVSPAQTLDEYAGDVVGLMDALSIERAVIGGLSMGGYITFALFRLAPARFDGVILADTKAPADTSEGLAGRRAMRETLRSQGVSAVVDSLLPKVVGETTRRERPQVLADIRRLMERNQPAAIDAALHALMNRQDSTPDLGRIRHPTLVVVGQEDTVTPTTEAEHLASAIASAELVVLRRAGHLSNLEVPEAFSNALSKFLSRAF